MTTKADEIETICKCQYTLTLSDEEDTQEIKDNFNGIPSIHEIIEEDSENENETERILEQPDPPTTDNVQNTKDASEDEFAYTGDCFYSDESCNESEISNNTPKSLNTDSLSSFRVTDLHRSENSKLQHKEVIDKSRWKNDFQDNELCSLNEELPQIAMADRFTKPRRWNMSFTDEEMRKIERDNELLLRKIMAQQKPRHKIFGERIIQSRISSSAINRKKLQKKIQDDNMLLLRRIQQAKSCVLTNASKMGCRLTFL